jgi:hypothetical protein
MGLKERMQVDRLLLFKVASRCRMGLCRNDGCYSPRRDKSSLCAECSRRGRGPNA